MPAQQLSQSELRYRRLFEAAHDGILIVDPDTRKIVDVNPFLVSFLGYTRAEIIGKELFELGLLEDEVASRASFRELQTKGFIRYEDLPLQTKNGRRVDVEFVSNIYQEGERQIIQCNIRDITARKRSERELREAKKELALHSAALEATISVRTAELRQSHAQMETFVYSIAHDLRAPLRTMQGFSQLLVQDHGAQLDQQGHDYAGFINAAAQTMDRLLTDLLAFSHVTQLEIELTPVALQTLVAEALSDCAEVIQESHTQVGLQATWPVVLAHAATLRQVLVNLISNAVKFVAHKTPQVRLRSEERPRGIIRLWVEDNGIGIPAHLHERIFQVFQRLNIKQYAGTGIGLAIVQKGVARMHGQVGVESKVGIGSQFWIDLPRAPEPAGPKSP